LAIATVQIDEQVAFQRVGDPVQSMNFACRGPVLLQLDNGLETDIGAVGQLLLRHRRHHGKAQVFDALAKGLVVAGTGGFSGLF